MDFMYENIKEYLGENWLSKERKKLMVELNTSAEIKEKISDQTFLRIDNLIEKVKYLDGFSTWVKEVKTANDVKDFIFELLCFENFMSKSIEFRLKARTPTGKNNEGLAKIEQKEVYIEMLNIHAMDTTPRKKVHAFFKKAKSKFTDKDGVLFVGCTKIQLISDTSPDIRLSPQTVSIIDEIKKQLEHGENKKIGGVVLVIMAWFVNPENDYKLSLIKNFLVLPKPKNKGGMPIDFFFNLINADEVLDESHLKWE